MPILLFILFVACLGCTTSTSIDRAELKRLEDRASQVTIIRDNWGVPHIYGKTDADAVFGLMYAQCEESFDPNKIHKLLIAPTKTICL